MAKFKIGNYQGIKIDCWTAKDLVGLHHLMKQEGCPNSENLFSDTDKAIELDDVQRRISQKHHADKKSGPLEKVCGYRSTIKILFCPFIKLNNG